DASRIAMRGGARRAPSPSVVQERRRPTSGLARSEPVAVLMHAGGTARVALALRVARERVDEHFAPRPGLLIRSPPGIAGSDAPEGPAVALAAVGAAVAVAAVAVIAAAHLAEGGPGHAYTIHSDPARAAAFADLGDEAVRLKRRAGHGVRRWCEGQRKARNGDESDHPASPLRFSVASTARPVDGRVPAGHPGGK